MAINQIIEEWLYKQTRINIVKDFPEKPNNEKQLSFYIESQKASTPQDGKQHIECQIKLIMRQQSGNDELNYLTNKLMQSKDSKSFKYASGLPEEIEYASATETVITKSIFAFITVEVPKNHHQITEVIWNE